MGCLKLYLQYRWKILLSLQQPLSPLFLPLPLVRSCGVEIDTIVSDLGVAVESCPCGNFVRSYKNLVRNMVSYKIQSFLIRLRILVKELKFL